MIRPSEEDGLAIKRRWPVVVGTDAGQCPRGPSTRWLPSDVREAEKMFQKNEVQVNKEDLIFDMNCK
jgi:hypothetical protein